MTKPSLRKTGLALGVAIALAAGSAEAAYTPNDVFLANNSFVDVTTSGKFSFGADLFHFTLSSASNIVVDMKNLLGSDITFAQADIESSPGVDVFNWGWHQTSRPSDYSFSLSNLAAGNYTLQVWGYTTSTKDSAPGDTGSYRVSLNVPAVPEPGEWAMLLAGLGLVGAIARRRSATR